MQRIQQFIKVILILFFLLLGFHSVVYAEQLNSVKECLENPDNCSEEQLKPQETEDVEGTDINTTVGLTIWDFIKMIFATIFVVALLYFLLRFINKKNTRYQNNSLVRNIGGTALGANRSVQLIKVGNRILVLGVGDNIQLLKEIEDEEEASQIITEYNDKIEQLVGPSDIVTRILRKAKERITHEKKQEIRPFSSILSKQLEDMSKGRKELFEEMNRKGPDEQ